MNLPKNRVEDQPSPSNGNMKAAFYVTKFQNTVNPTYTLTQLFSSLFIEKKSLAKTTLNSTPLRPVKVKCCPIIYIYAPVLT